MTQESTYFSQYAQQIKDDYMQNKRPKRFQISMITFLISTTVMILAISLENELGIGFAVIGCMIGSFGIVNSFGHFRRKMQRKIRLAYRMNHERFDEESD